MAPSTRIDLRDAQGRDYRVQLPAPDPQLTSAYIFAFAKSGSTLLDNMITSYCAAQGVPTFSLFGQAFEQGIQTAQIQADASACFRPSGYVYTGFRAYPVHFELSLENAPCVWLTRDPRDMLVSQYYSVLKSHRIPRGNTRLAADRELAAEMGIDAFALKMVNGYRNRFRRYRKHLAPFDPVVYRYEDVIYEKAQWLDSVVEVLGLPRDPGLVREVAGRHDVIPDREDQGAHIRQVHPGNHRNQLSPATIAQVNASLAEFLEYFDYEA